MPNRVALTLEGSLLAQISQATASCGAGADPGSYYKFGNPRNAATEQAAGAILQTIDSALAFEDLALPGGMVGRFLYFRNVGGGDLDLRVTFATQGVTVFPLRAGGAPLILEPSADEGIEALEVQGSSEISWLLAGDA